MALRIIGGIHRSRILKTSHGQSTRPTRAVVREAAFNLLQGFVTNSRVLDLFAGSGAMGLEALSRGAEFVAFCDKDHKAIQTIKWNAKMLKEEDNCCFLHMDWRAAINQLKKTEPFDLVFLDPPYGMLLNNVLLDLAQMHILADDAIILTEQDIKQFFRIENGYYLFKQRSYGQTALFMLKWEGIP